MKRLAVFVLLAAGGGALALSAACGSLLGITPDDPGASDGSASDGSANDGGSSEGGDDGATDRGLGAELMPASISLVAGDKTGVTVVVAITRPTADPTPVMVTVAGGTDVVATPLPNTDTRAPTQSFVITAIDTAVPRRETINVTVTDGTRMVIRALTIAIAQHYRTGGLTTIEVAGPQTFAITAWGAGGGDPSGGAGGFAQGILTLETGAYYIVVGHGAQGSTGGMPGGGMSGGGSNAKGGGGFSGLFAQSADGGLDFSLARLVAGGGGGGCVAGGTQPGGGGGSTETNSAEDGRGSFGSGASPGAGGLAGPSSVVPSTPGTAGIMLQGGNGGSDATNSGGGGGGGYYGGGGGGADGTAGGGGSSFVFGTASGRLTVGGHGSTPGMVGDALRKDAGAVGADGAVIIVPQ